MRTQPHRAFGDLLRRARKESGLTIKEVADHLGHTVGYISDIERGRRDPLKSQDIDKVCKRLSGEWKNDLYKAAVKAKGAITLKLKSSNGQQVKLAAALLRKWQNLSDDDLGKISSIIKEDEH